MERAGGEGAVEEDVVGGEEAEVGGEAAVAGVKDAAEGGALEEEHDGAGAVVGVEGGDGEVAVGVRDEHRRAQLHLHEGVGAIEL